jgi:hypothetical protein
MVVVLFLKKNLEEYEKGGGLVEIYLIIYALYMFYCDAIA